MADPKFTKQQVDDAKELKKLLQDQPRLLRTISGMWESINKSIQLSESSSKKIASNNKDFLDITKQVLSNTKDVHKETVDWSDINDEILKSQKAGDKVLGDQYKQLNRLQKSQKRYNNLVNAGANSISNMVSGIESTIRQIPFIGDFIGDAINFGDISKDMQDTFREGAQVVGGFVKEGIFGGSVEGFTSGMVENAGLGKMFLGSKFVKGFKKIFGAKGAAATGATAAGVNMVGQKLLTAGDGAEGVVQGFSKMKLLGLGIAAAVVAMAAGMAKFAFETGLSVGQTLKLSPALLINKGYVVAMAEEFGTINDVNTKIAWQLKKQSFFYGIEAAQAVKLLRIQTALSDSSHEQLINVQNTVANFARAKGVLPSKVFDDIAGATELMAKHASGAAEGFMKAAVHIRAMGVGLDVADQISTHLLDIEGSINAQFEANAVLGTQMNFDMARRLMMQNDLVGMMEEVKRQIGDQIDLEKLNVVERNLIAKAAGTDIVNLTKMLSAQEKVSEAATKTKNAFTAVSVVVMGIVGIIAGALMATKVFAKQGAKILAGGIAGGVTGAAAGATIVAPFVNKVMQNDFVSRPGMNPIPFSPDDTIIGTKNPAGLGGGGGNSQIAMAITNQTRAMNKLEQTISKGQAQSTQQRQSMIDATTKGQNKLYRGFTEG
jgi:hypothetical protein